MEPNETIVLVTGASRGIGRSIAKMLMQKENHIVIGTATGQKGLDIIKRDLKESGNSGSAMSWDALAGGAKTLIETVQQKYQKTPDVLVNNAGITRDNLSIRMKKDQWDECLHANLTACFEMTQACLKGMLKKRWGRIVTVSSVVGVIGNAGQTNYAAAKAGVIGFSKSLAAEVASRNITVNCVCPGFIETDMLDFLSEDQKKQVMMQIPMKRLGSVEEVAYAVDYLVSERASYVTGTCLHVNGGLVML